jgi:hypothetical protein
VGEAENAAAVERLWTLFEARAWDASLRLFHPDLEVEWPHTRERFVGPSNFVAMNRAYPEGWTIELLRVIADGDVVASEIRVTQDDDVYVAASFFEFEAGLIRRATEYWVTSPYEDPAPWRAPYRAD